MTARLRLFLVVVAFAFASMLILSVATERVELQPWMPNIGLPFVVFAITTSALSTVQSAWIALIVGYFMDVFSGYSFGPHAAVFMTIFVLLSVIENQIRYSGLGFRLGLVGVSAFSCVVLSYLLRDAIGGVSSRLSTTNLMYQATTSTIATVVVGVVVLIGLEAISLRLGATARRWLR